MIGYYNISVVLTYLGLAAGVLGIGCSIAGNVRGAMLFLVVSGICDMFDGKIARAVKRSDGAKAFGIQIDSLCDLVCFGVAPVVFCYTRGMSDAPGLFVLIVYLLAAIIRLAYFNVTEAERQRQTTEKRKYYEGLPVTSIAAILPLATVLRTLTHAPWRYALDVLMALVALAFVLKIRVRKPGGIFPWLMLGLCIAVGILIYCLK